MSTFADFADSIANEITVVIDDGEPVGPFLTYEEAAAHAVTRWIDPEVTVAEFVDSGEFTFEVWRRETRH